LGGQGGGGEHVEETQSAVDVVGTRFGLMSGEGWRGVGGVFRVVEDDGFDIVHDVGEEVLVSVGAFVGLAGLGKVGHMVTDAEHHPSVEQQ
jgi:hypothetical protein